MIQRVIGATPWKLRLYSQRVSKRGSILDFGCSMGVCTDAFIERDYTGIDIDQKAIATAQVRYRKHPSVKFECRDILVDGITKNTFDSVVFGCAGHHISDSDLRKIIPLLMDSLKRGGRLYFFDPIVQKNKDSIITRFFIAVDQGRFMRTSQEYRVLFESIGYQIVTWEICESPHYLTKLQDILYIELAKGGIKKDIHQNMDTN